MTRSATVALLLCLGLVSRDAGAQAPVRDRVEVSGGVRWIGPVSFGSVSADEVTLGNGRSALFESATTLDGSFGATAAASVRVIRALRVEGTVAYNPSGLSTRITDDVEDVADTTVRAPVTQFLFEAGLLGELRQGRRFTPFVTGGAGYLRQLNDGRTLVETGMSYYAGAGLYYVRTSSRPRRVKASGARVDLRAVFLRDGVSPDSSFRGAPALTAALFARF